MRIYPVSDVQIGAQGVDTVGFRNYIEEAINDPIGRLIGVGDYTDGMSPSNRKVLLGDFIRGDLYDTPRDFIDAAARDSAQEFVRLVDGTRGRWDALLKGHHLWEYKVPYGAGYRIRTTDEDIADAVGAPYLGEPGTAIGSAIINYVFPARAKGKKRPVLRMYVTHGQGGSGTFAGPLNQLEKMMRAFTADIYMVAHHHKAVAARAVKLSEDLEHPTNLRAQDSALVCTGSWMRGYMPGITTYAEDGLMVPLATGSATVGVTVKKDDSFRIRVEV